MTPEQLALCVGIVGAAAFLRGAVGFGDALFSMPLLSLVLGPRTAAPVVAAMVLLLALVVGLGLRRHVDGRALAWLCAGAVPGVVVGVWGLARAPESLLFGALGAMCVGHVALTLRAPAARRLHDPLWGAAFGAVGGVLGGATTVTGPPAVLYAQLSGWSADTMRATLQAYFVVTATVMLIAQGAGGLVHPDVLRVLAYAAPALAAGAWLGHRAVGAAPPSWFHRAVQILLLLTGGSALVRAAS